MTDLSAIENILDNGVKDFHYLTNGAAIQGDGAIDINKAGQIIDKQVQAALDPSLYSAQQNSVEKLR